MSGGFYLVMMQIRLAVGQWTLDTAVTALAVALILRVRRCRVRVERLPAAEEPPAPVEPDGDNTEAVEPDNFLRSASTEPEAATDNTEAVEQDNPDYPESYAARTRRTHR